MNSSGRAILSLTWQSLAYGIGVLGSQAIVYLMLPLLTRYMTAAEYGAVSVIMTLYALLNTLTNAGLPIAAYRFYNNPPEEEHRRQTLGTSQFLFFLFAALPAAAIVLLPHATSVLLLGSDRYSLALQLAAVFLVVDSLNLYGSVILRIQVRPLIASIQAVIISAGETGMAILFVVGYHMGAAGYWLGYLIGGCIGLAFTAYFVRSAISFSVSWSKVAALMKYGGPLIPATLAMTALRLADRYIIGSLASLEQVAIYDVGYKLGSIVVLLISPFRTAWSPFAFSIAQRKETPRIYRDVLTYLLAGCMFLILGVIAFQAELLHVLAPASYAGAYQVVAWVAASQFFLAVYTVVSMGPMLVDQTYALTWTAVVAAVLNVALNFVLIPSQGIAGAAIATFASYLMLALSTYLVAKRSFPLEIDWNRLARLFLVTLLVVLLIWGAPHWTSAAWTRYGIKISALLLFPILLVPVGVVSRGQLASVVEFGKSWAMRKLAGSETGEH